MQIKSKIVERNARGLLEPLVGAQIFIADPNATDLKVYQGLGTTTDGNGNFVLNIPDGLVYDDIVIQYMGYQTLYTDATYINMSAYIILEEDAHTLPGVTITAPAREKDKFPDWLIMLLIPFVFSVLILIYKVINRNKERAQHSSKLR
ncbi:MAG: carboxypeptidase-like regulatory domain-containing protein [Chitinophagales bacterium]|nr:carboxypeptidase-like regulatory domain-containing protein [Chitinophagales bacterium]